MNVLSFLGTYAVYFWVLVTLLFGMFLEVCFVALFFYEWKDRRSAKRCLLEEAEGPPFFGASPPPGVLLKDLTPPKDG